MGVITCPECWGTGEDVSNPESDRECPYCEGTGIDLTEECTPAPSHEIVTFDWKTDPGEIINLFANELKKLGIQVTSIPSFEGSDTYGLVLSKKKLSKKEIREIDKELI